MSPLKTALWGGAAVVVLGPPMVAGVMVSLGQGTGTFGKILVEDGLPALTDGLKYEGGKTPGLFGEPAPGAVEPAPVDPSNPG